MFTGEILKKKKKTMLDVAKYVSLTFGSVGTCYGMQIQIKEKSRCGQKLTLQGGDGCPCIIGELLIVTKKYAFIIFPNQ